MLPTALLPASAAVRGVGRGYKQETLLGERRFPARGLRGAGPGDTVPIWWLPQGVSTYRGVGDRLHQACPRSRWQKGLEPSCVPGSGDRAVNKVGKGAATLELPFILVMETDKRKATRTERIITYSWSVLWRSQ